MFHWGKAMMGFDDDKIRVRREFRNKKCTAVIEGKKYVFDSLFEGHWFLYQQFLKEQKQIRSWVFHPVCWDFFQFGYRNKPYEYTPDGLIIENDGTEIYQELKGHIETKDVSRLRRASDHYGARFDLVMQKLPRKGAGTQIIARASQYAFVRRVIDGTAILRQVKGIIDFSRVKEL